MPGLTLNAEPEGLSNSYWMSTVVLSPALGIEKEDLLSDLAARDIDARPFFYPLSAIPAFYDQPESARARAENVVAARISPYGVNLPSAAVLDADSVGQIADILIEVLGEGRSGVRRPPSSVGRRVA